MLSQEILSQVSAHSHKRIRTADFSETLREAGFDVLGNGVNAVAVSSGDTVVKIFNADDEGYLDFLEFCKVIESKHLPKIYSFQRYGQLCVVEMERLNSGAITLSKDVIYAQIHNHIENKFGIFNDNLCTSALTPEFKTIIELLCENVGIHCLDIHRGNFMFRGDTPVIIDPYC